MKPFLTLGLALCLAGLNCAALAHGVQPAKRGGIVDVGGETTFELVRKGKTIVVYIDDHGDTMDTKGATGEILLGSLKGKSLGGLVDNDGSSVKGTFKPFRKGDRLFVRVSFRRGNIHVGEILIP